MLEISTFLDPLNVSEAPSFDQSKTLLVMTMSFIRKNIDIGMHDIMFQVSQQHVEIVKLIFHNKVQQDKELESS